MIRFLSYSVKEAFKGIKANKEAYLITIGTTAISMTIFGIFLVVFFNLHEVVKEWKEKIQIVIYLEDNIKQKGLDSLKNYLNSIQQIDEYRYISKEEALKKFRKRLNSNQSILDNLTTNPLPASLELKLKKPYRNYSHTKKIVVNINKLNGVEDIEFGEGWLERFEAILSLLKFLAFAIGGLVCIGIIFIISNTTKLSVYARKEEIEIMQIVGATDWFVKGPFLFEGIIQGFCGVIISLTILYGLYQAFIANLQSSSFFIGAHSFLFLPASVINYMILLGILIGCIGSFISLGKFLNK